MASRLRLQYGALHIEYEGSDEFLRTELPALVEQIARLLPGTPAASPAPPVMDATPETIRF